MGAAATDSIEDLAKGQKAVIASLVLHLVAVAAIEVSGALFIIAFALSVALGWGGVYRITRGLLYPFAGRMLLLWGMLVPFAGVLLLLFLNHRATSRLRQAGYQVGLMGVRKR